MDPQLPNVLTDEHRMCLDNCLHSTVGTAKLIDALEKCGIDCTEQRAKNDMHVKAATMLKSQFFPNHS
jgi:hypothetical protein